MAKETKNNHSEMVKTVKEYVLKELEQQGFDLDGLNVVTLNNDIKRAVEGIIYDASMILEEKEA